MLFLEVCEVQSGVDLGWWWDVCEWLVLEFCVEVNEGGLWWGICEF